ncbi:calmodulin binding protein PICBP-like [Euphorbia lathyris]|uniref:calmodulin binding protein PICBP-like n=1 Tax=Euphorbia lathyris TaxID=212925 RepID=UPI0033131811
MISSKSDLDDSSISGTETLSVISESDSSFNNGAAETKRKLRSIKLVKLPSVRLRQRQPNYMKTTTCSTAKKDNFQKSKPPRSLTRLPSTKFRRPGGSDLRKKMNKSKSIKLRNQSYDAENAQFQASPRLSKSDLSNKSPKVVKRMSSMRPVRMLKKMSSLRTNRNIQRSTCSWTLKDSKFPNHLELESGGSESQGISTIKVCPYTYCSLHGHSHSTLPPLKRFVSMRRRALRTQKSSLRPKTSSNVKKGIRGRKLSSYKDAAVRETANTSKVLSSRSVSEDVLGEDGSVESSSPKYVLNATETDNVTSSYEEISVTGKFHHEVNEGESSTSNLADWGGDLEENASAGVVSRSIGNTISSVPICENLEEESVATEEKNGDSFPKTDLESDYNSHVVEKSEMEKQKHMGLWHLIYKHMESGIEVEDEVQAPATETDKEEVEDADTCPPGTHKSGSSDFSGSDRGLDVDIDHEKGSHIQLYQRNAIKFEDVHITSSHEEISVTGKLHHEVNESESPTSDQADWGGDSELITWEENASAGVVSRSIGNAISSVPICEQVEEESVAYEENNGDSFPKTDSESDYNTHVVDKSAVEKQKHMGLWNLIYKHMASGISVEDEVQAPATETDKEEVEDAETRPGEHKSGSSDFSGSDGGLDVDIDHEKGSHIQLYQRNAIKFEDVHITSSHEEISVTGKLHHDVNEGESPTSNQADWGGDSELITWEENASAGVVSRSIGNTISPVPICEQLEEESVACEEKNRDSFPKTDSGSDYNTHVVDKSDMEKQKHMGLWHLIYKHMASGIAVEDEVQAPATETDKEEVEDAETRPGKHKSDSHGLDVDNNHEKGSHIQLYQRNAIKLVKEAFDKILSEIPDQSPDDQSSDSGSTRNKEFSENNCDGEALSIPTSFNSRKESPAQEPEKTMLNTDITNGLEVEKTQSEMGSKSKQETPRNWSYLKKIFVLNRFVKALDKAKKFNPRKPRFLPIPSDPEAEKIHLRHQSLEEKKKSEEWMLDYALQQVISTLAPSQKRKVALLVQAFESVGPLPNTGSSPSSNLDASSHATQDESCIGLSYQKSSGKGEETYFGISLHKTALPNKRCDENLHHINDSFTEEEDPDSFSMLKENLESSALSPQVTAAALKENFGVINLDNNDHNSTVKDDQPDSINCCLVQDVPKLADVANTSNDVLANGEVSESDVHDIDLGFNDQDDVADTSNYVLADGEVSASEVHDLDLGFNDQHDIANTVNDVLANGEVSASEVHDLHLGFNDQHDVANTSNSVLASGEISESEVHDQHDVANTSNDVLANGEVSASDVHDLDLKFNDQHDAANTSSDVLSEGEVSASEVHHLDLGFNDQHDVANTSNDVLLNEEVSSSEGHDLDLGFNKQQLPSSYQINERGEQSDGPQNQILQTLEDSSANGDVNSLVSVPELVEISKVTKRETTLSNKFLQLITPREESKASSTELTHEKQRNMGLWHLIYKHMVSGTTTLLEEAEQGSHVIVSHGMNNTDGVHHVAGSQKVDFQQIEAIRMVEEAIDEIPLPDSQDDSPDDHPITSDIIPDQENIKKQPGRVSGRTEAIHSTECLNSEDTATEGGEKNAFGVANKTKQPARKSWSNLKKMILLRRFVKALEKVKKFNPREPQLLPLDSEKEAEKVLLRHQDTEDRKNADEWMLDYALQQVVAKLTPARKRKVQLLVEAFETVSPTIET